MRTCAQALVSVGITLRGNIVVDVWAWGQPMGFPGRVLVYGAAHDTRTEGGVGPRSARGGAICVCAAVYIVLGVVSREPKLRIVGARCRIQTRGHCVVFRHEDIVSTRLLHLLRCPRLNSKGLARARKGSRTAHSPAHGAQPGSGRGRGAIEHAAAAGAEDRSEHARACCVCAHVRMCAQSSDDACCGCFGGG